MVLTRWGLVVIVTIAGFAAAFNVGKVAPTLLLIRDELQTGLFEMGLVVSSFSILTMLLAIPVGVLAARVGVYRSALCALALLGTGALISSQAGSLPALLGGRVVEGLGYVAIVVSAPALIAMVVAPKDRPVAMGIWATWLPIGIGFMLTISPFMIDQGGWRYVWLFTGIFAFCWLLVIGWSFHNQLAKTPQSAYQRGDWKILLQRGPLLITAGFACFSSLFIVAASFLPTVWQQSKGIPVQSTAGMMAFAISANALGNLVGGWLISRGFRASRIMVACFTLPALWGGFAFVDSIPFWGQYSLAASYMFICGVIPGAAFATVPAFAHSPRQISLLVGMVFQGAATGQVMGPVLFSKIIEFAGGDWNYAICFFVGFALLGGILMWRIPEPVKP
ncbi:MAG: CynX/NimT family MFS transporter [Thiolinea sp.]